MRSRLQISVFLCDFWAKTKKILGKNTAFSVQYEAFSIVFCNFTSEKGKKNTS